MRGRLQRELSELEQRISELEAEAKNVESTLATADGPDVYEQYADILAELERLNTRYYEIGEQPLLNLPAGFVSASVTLSMVGVSP